MQDVFLSYGREDEEAANLLGESLQDEGFSVWIDHDIPPGKTWDQVIGQALESAGAVVVLWSSHSVESRWVREEAEKGLRRDRLIPVLIEDVEPPLGFSRIEAANLIGWTGDTSDREYQALSKAVRAVVSQDGGTVPPVKPPRRPRKPRPDPVLPEPEKKKKKRWPLVAALVAVALLIGYYAIPVDDGYDDPYQFVDPGGDVIETGLADVQVSYSGDQLGCTLNLSVSIDGEGVVPRTDPFTVPDVSFGLVDYLVTGTIVCPTVGSCQAYGEGSLNVRQDYQVFQLSWLNTGVGQCGVMLNE